MLRLSTIKKQQLYIRVLISDLFHLKTPLRPPEQLTSCCTSEKFSCLYLVDKDEYDYLGFNVPA